MLALSTNNPILVQEAKSFDGPAWEGDTCATPHLAFPLMRTALGLTVPESQRS